MSYPDPHYDEDDTCLCPDHQAMRKARKQEEADSQPVMTRLFLRFLEGSS